jgi:phosphatidate cytidylyltransferase
VKRVLTAAVLIPLVLLAVFRAPVWLFALLVVPIAVVAALEYLNLAERSGVIPFRRATLLMVVGLLIFPGSHSLALNDVYQLPEGLDSTTHILLNVSRIGAAIVVAMPLLLLIWGMRRRDLNTTLSGAAVSAFALAYIAFPLQCLVLIKALPFGALALLFLFVLVWVGDIFAYYIGSILGHHKMAPSISPGKSWEGAGASTIAAALAGSLFLSHTIQIKDFLEMAHLLLPNKSWDQSIVQLSSLPWWNGMLLSIGINVAAQLGDLAESMLKRGAAVKDSGNLFPGHGGMLDRIDALLFAAPVLWYYATFRLIPF